MQNDYNNKNIFENDEDNQVELKEQAKERRQRIISTVLFAILAVLIVLLFTFVFICSPATINGESMSPTLNDGQVIMISRIHKTPVLGDIIVYNKPTENKKVIKRVVGVPGDKFYFTSNPSGQAFLIKEGQEKIYSLSQEQRNFLIATYHNNRVPDGDNYGGQYYFVVGKDEVFTIGDNASNSIDGRNYGPIKIRSIIGIKLN